MSLFPHALALAPTQTSGESVSSTSRAWPSTVLHDSARRRVTGFSDCLPAEVISVFQHRYFTGYPVLVTESLNSQTSEPEVMEMLSTVRLLTAVVNDAMPSVGR